MVNGGNRGRRDLKIIGEEYKPLVDIGRVETNAPEWNRERMRAILAGQCDGLVRTNASRAIHWIGATSSELDVVPGAQNKIGHRSMETEESWKIDVATIHDNEATRFGQNMIEHVGIMAFDIGDIDQYWDDTVEVE